VAGGHSAGGSAGLAELIDKHGEELYFDLHHYAGLNLVQALRYGSGYSPRQILTLVRQLPLESATVAAIRGGHQFRGWGVDRYMMANVVDAVNENTYATIAVSGATKRKPKQPEPVWRPKGLKDGKPKRSTFAAMAASFFKAAQRKPEEQE
jgi:hypothetical protein